MDIINQFRLKGMLMNKILLLSALTFILFFVGCSSSGGSDSDSGYVNNSAFAPKSKQILSCAS